MAVFTVQTLDDSGVNANFGADALADQDGGGLSLREALHWAQDGDEIIFSTTGTITLTAELFLGQDVTIDGDTSGDDKADITLSGGGANRIFSVGSSVHASLLSLTLSNGYTSNNGGAIYSGHSSSTLDIVDTTISSSIASSGGGIFANGVLNLTNSTLSENYAGFTGGALRLSGYTTAVLVNTTLSFNSAAQYGGAIDMNPSVHLTIANSTISGNSHSGSSTLAGGINLFGGSVLRITNSVVAQNAGGTNPDISEYGANSTIYATNSFFGSATGLVLDTDVSNQFGNAMLGALASNGGTVQTHAILAGSALIGAGDASLRPADTFDLDGDSNITEPLPLDANGNARVLGGGLDIGASEFALTVTSGLDSPIEDAGADLATDRSDGNGLSLREAIFWAAENQSIGFSSALAGTTIGLQTGLYIGQSITIDGGNGVTISGDVGTVGQDSADVRIFDISGSGTDVTLRGLTLTGGRADSSNGVNGGAILTAAGTTLTLVNSTVSNSVATNGAGIYAAGTLNIANSTLHGNTASSFGGGIYAGANATLVNTTLTANSAAFGGGIDTASSALLNITSSTISGNSATSSGGGIDLYGHAQAVIYNSIVSGNTGAGLVDISKLGPPPNGPFTGLLLGSFSVFGTTVDVDGGTYNSNTYTNTPGLGALADNGGSVLTMLPSDGSAAIGRGDNGSVPLDEFDIDGDGNTTEVLPIDARGGSRIVGTVDAGAVEVGNRAPIAVDDANSGDAVKEDIDTTATGNVLTNDTDFNVGDTTVVYLARVGRESGSNTFGALTGTFVGIYGSLVISANGTFTYTLNNADPDTNALAAGQTVHDYFSYIVRDSGLMSDIGEIDITVTGTNDAPTINNSSSAASVALSMAETAVPWPIAFDIISATDVDFDPLTFSLSGADASLFSIHSSGALSFVAPPDFDAPTDAGRDNVYDVTVTASDGALTDTQAYAITITNTAGNTITGGLLPDVIDGATPAGNAATNEEDNIDGGAGNDTIFALGGNDTVRGGLGKDSMDGGTGRDTLDYAEKTKPVTVVLNGAVFVSVKVGAAEDMVANFESVIGSTGADKLTGDGLDNLLRGENGNDALTGAGGADTLIGGFGNDKLNGDAGNDSLDGGAGKDAITGGAGSDTLIAGGGGDTLTGDLKGGLERDFFVFNAAAVTANANKIADMTANVDIIQLDDAFFAAIGPTLTADEFVSGAKAKALDANDFLLYDTKTGTLSYDADGNGIGKAVKIATLSNKPHLLDHEDFMIV